METTKQRYDFMDVLRIIAILCVIYNHTGSDAYYLYALPCGMILKCFYIIVGALIAVAVPIFFMISGALLLPKEERLYVLFKKRILRMIVVLIIASAGMYAYKGFPGNFKGLLFTDGVLTSYWYLYAYIAYLLILPILRKMVKVLDWMDYLYLLLLSIFVEGVLPAIFMLIGISRVHIMFVLPLINRVVIFPLLGYAMVHVGKEKLNGKTIYGLALISLLITIVMTLYRNLPLEKFTQYDKGLFTSSFTTFLSIAVFYAVMQFCERHKMKAGVKKIIRELASATFGVYLIEEISRDLTYGIVGKLSSVTGQWIAAVCWVIVAWFLASVLVIILKKIPGIHKLL